MQETGGGIATRSSNNFWNIKRTFVKNLLGINDGALLIRSIAANADRDDIELA
jgi:hypothetical protein